MKRYVFLFLILILISCLKTAPVFSQLLDKIVAIVNDEVITLSELKEVARQLTHLSDPPPEVERKVLEELINTRLAAQQARRLGIEVKDEEVEKAVQDILKQNRITLEQLKADLAKGGLSYEEYKNWLKEQIIKSKLISLEVQGKVTVTEDEMMRYYKEHQNQYKGYTEFHLCHILLSLPETPEEEEKIKQIQTEILRQLQSGVSFSVLAQEYSQAPTAKEGGDLGWIKEKDLAPEIKMALAKLKPGEFSPWLKTEVGYQLVQLVEKRQVLDKPFAEVKKDIYQVLYRQKVEERYKRWLEQLRKKAYVKVLL
ncbi:MAG: peptidylprolyl isomerase [Candidatus Desulfofervidaceae bacterium]|nr:peptidylprolyl isomerase [Candidatus Desulfofervidaceae bacterium]MDL1970655.1 peptidylprolyl isomerase [Candidatus Desulfofervidaceae bacterium]